MEVLKQFLTELFKRLFTWLGLIEPVTSVIDKITGKDEWVKKGEDLFNRVKLAQTDEERLKLAKELNDHLSNTP